MNGQDIPEEMVEKATVAVATVADEATGETFARDYAVAALSAALEGCAVVQLPEPDGTDETGTWWNHDNGAVIADQFCTEHTVQVMRRRAAALLAAADHIERRLASGSGVGDQPAGT